MSTWADGAAVESRSTREAWPSAPSMTTISPTGERLASATGAAPSHIGVAPVSHPLEPRPQGGYRLVSRTWGSTAGARRRPRPEARRERARDEEDGVLFRWGQWGPSSAWPEHRLGAAEQR